jgi:hypothetical protein
MKQKSNPIFKFSDEDLDWAIDQLQRFEGLPGVPQTVEGLKSFAGAFLRIVCDQAAFEVEEYDTTARTPIKRKIEAVSRQEVTDWLINQLCSTCERFPMPIAMRRVYESKYICADRMTSGDLEVR